jgi:RNA polymerase sigma-54 factor
MLEMKQQLRLQQQMVMTPQLQQAIKLLQLTRMELVEVVQHEIDENPLLEDTAEATNRGDGAAANGGSSSEAQAREPSSPGPMAQGDPDGRAVREIDWENYLNKYADRPSLPTYRGEDPPSLETTLTRRASLTDHLIGQLRLARFDGADEAIATLIVGNLDADGYLREPPLDQIAADSGRSCDDVERVLSRIQEFDPAGVAARSLEECLLLQLRRQGMDDDVVVQVIQRHLAAIARKDYAAIARDLGQPVDEIVEAAKAIRALVPCPGRLFSEEEPVYITPDIYLHKVGDKYFVVPNDDGMPKLKISGHYRSMMSHSPRAKEYIKEKMRSAAWLIRSIQQRQRTIVRTTESIVRFQREFLDRGLGYLKPLILRDVADDIGMHESTVSRVTTNKYVHTPRGIFELKFFFNSGIGRTDGGTMASESVRERIRKVIHDENPQQPYSDQRLVDLLRAETIDIARRTVAKYRDQLGIRCASARRRAEPT